jgi:hypothetical protein
VGSKTYEGVRFSVYSHDHSPPHVHAILGNVRVIVDLLADGGVMLSKRRDAMSPLNAKRNVVSQIVDIATENATELQQLWERIHGHR